MINNANFALRISLINTKSAKWLHELVYGMWNPDFCSAEAHGVQRFIEEMEEQLKTIKTAGPDLLAALEQIRGFVAVMDESNWRDLRLHIQRQCSVIAKAEGKP